MSTFLQIAAFMHIQDFHEAVRFFVETLGFKPWRQGDYAYGQRESVAIRIVRASTSPGEIPGPGTRAFRYYIDVRDVDAIYAELKPKLDTMWPGRRLHAPVNQGYAQRNS